MQRASRSSASSSNQLPWRSCARTLTAAGRVTAPLCPALIGGLLILRHREDLGVHKVDELVLVILRDLFRCVGGVPHHEQAAQYAHLRAGQTHAVGGDHGLTHIVQQGGQTIVKVGNGAADLVQDGVAFFYNVADCHISLHWDGDGLSYDKGCFYIAVPDAIKDMEPVATHWQQHNALGASLVNWLGDVGMKIHGSGSMAIDLTQTSYSTIPSVDMELGNASSDHSDETLENIADGLMAGINAYYGY